MSKEFDSGVSKGNLGKAPPATNAGIPLSTGGPQGFGQPNTYQYPAAEINYDQLDGAPVDGTPLYMEAGAGSSGQNAKLSRFRIRGYKDLWAAVLFVLFLVFSLVWSFVQLATYNYATDTHNRTSPFSDQHGGSTAAKSAAACLAAGIISILTSIGMLLLAQRMPVQLIYIANIASILLLLISAVVSFVKIEVVVGILMLICAIFQAVWLFLVRDRIPFAAALLRISAQLINRYKLTWVLNMFLCFLSFGYVVVWGCGVAAPVDRFYNEKGNAGYGVVIGLLVFTLLWVSQVVPNVMHVTTSGLVATWYFAGSQNMPANPTGASFKRAMTTSFGSICFGSLVVAAIQFVRWLLESSTSDSENGFLRCLLDCILSCIEGMVRYFNRYAFVHVAIYGCGYIEGAKRTFALCEQCFFAAYFNDCLVSPTLHMFTFAISIVLAFIAGVIAQSWPIGVLVFFTAVLVHSLFFVAVDSAVTTIFVCFAECPEALRESDPELYETIHRVDANGTNNNAPPV